MQGHHSGEYCAIKSGGFPVAFSAYEEPKGALPPTHCVICYSMSPEVGELYFTGGLDGSLTLGKYPLQSVWLWKGMERGAESMRLCPYQPKSTHLEVSPFRPTWRSSASMPCCYWRQTRVGSTQSQEQAPIPGYMSEEVEVTMAITQAFWACSRDRAPSLGAAGAAAFFFLRRRTTSPKTS